VPCYEHQCEECGHVWEDLFSSHKSPVPEECPECKIKGKVKRLLSSTLGTVELTPRERTIKAYKEGKAIAKQAKKDENVLANIVGEEKYHKRNLS
jgi:putative FmdB family regulatory protein